MVNINNKEMKEAFSNSTKTQLLEQPNNVDNRNVIPIVDITPIKHKYAKTLPLSGSLTNATSVTLMTTPANKDVYLTAVCFSFAADTTATATEVSLKIVDGSEGATRSLLTMRRITLTAFNQTITQAFTPPIKVARSSAITITSDTNVANFVATARLEGYEEEQQ